MIRAEIAQPAHFFDFVGHCVLSLVDWLRVGSLWASWRRPKRVLILFSSKELEQIAVTAACQVF